VEGVSKLSPYDFSALVLFSDMQKTRAITTGNALVNRLIQNVEWGQKGNFLDVRRYVADVLEEALVKYIGAEVYRHN